MKKSIYNTVVILSSKTQLIFNAMANKFVVVKNMPDFKEINNLEAIDPKVYNDMVDAGVIIDEGVNEIEELKNLIRTIDNNEKIFHLHINPTMDCNFRCWYCYENHIEGSRLGEDVIERIIKFVKKKLNTSPELESFYLAFFGGEPLLYFSDNVMPIIIKIQEECRKHNVNLSVQFTSNGYLLDENIINDLKSVSCSFQITLDGGKSMHDKTRFSKGGTGSYDRILENIKMCSFNGIHVTLRINYTSKNIDSVSSIIEDLKTFPDICKRNVTIDFQRVWQDRKQAGEEDSTEKTAKEYIINLRRQGWLVSSYTVKDSVRNSCYGDKKNYILVNYNGDLFKCTAREFKRSNKIGEIDENGNLNFIDTKMKIWENYKFSSKVCQNCSIAPICGGGCRQKGFDFYCCPIKLR